MQVQKNAPGVQACLRHHREAPENDRVKNVSWVEGPIRMPGHAVLIHLLPVTTVVVDVDLKAFFGPALRQIQDGLLAAADSLKLALTPPLLLSVSTVVDDLFGWSGVPPEALVPDDADPWVGT